jgi:hypothetical protein
MYPEPYQARSSIALKEVVIPGVATPMMLLSTPVRNMPRANEIVTRANRHPLRYREVSAFRTGSTELVCPEMDGFSMEVLVEPSIVALDMREGRAKGAVRAGSGSATKPRE